VCVESENLCRMNKRGSITSREIQTSVRLILPGELAKHAVSEGTKAVTKFNASLDESENPGDKSSSRITVFPFQRIHSYLKEHWLGTIGKGAGIYLAAVLEYLCAEILELAGNAATDKETRHQECILPRHIMYAIRNDDELDRLCRRVIIPDCGGLPHIISNLLPHYPEPQNDQDDQDNDANEKEMQEKFQDLQVY